MAVVQVEHARRPNCPHTLGARRLSHHTLWEIVGALAFHDAIQEQESQSDLGDGDWSRRQSDLD